MRSSWSRLAMYNWLTSVLCVFPYLGSFIRAETAIVVETSQSYQNLPTDLGTSEDNGEAKDGEAAA